MFQQYYVSVYIINYNDFLENHQLQTNLEIKLTKKSKQINVINRVPYIILSTLKMFYFLRARGKTWKLSLCVVIIVLQS